MQAAGAAAGPGRGQQGGPRHREALLALKAESEATEAAPLPRRPLPRRAACCERGRRASPRGGRRSTGIKYSNSYQLALIKMRRELYLRYLALPQSCGSCRSPRVEEGSDLVKLQPWNVAKRKLNGGKQNQKRCAL